MSRTRATKMTLPQQDLGDPPQVDSSANPRSPEWLPETETSLRKLLSLPENWNSYSAAAIMPEIAQSAIELLRNIAGMDTPQPAVVPTVRGGIQLEWHTRGLDLEIEIPAPGHFLVYHADETEGSEWEGEFSSSELPRLAELTAELSRP